MIREFFKKNPWAEIGLFFLVGSIISMFSIQFLILDWEQFMKTSDYKLFLNVVCCLMLYLTLLFLTNRPAVSAIISHVFWLAVGFADFFVYSFRGNELSYADLSAMGTGLSVASKYTFSLNYRCIIVLVVAAIYIFAATRIKYRFEKKMPMRIISLLLIALSTVIVTLGAMGVNAETWEQKGSYHNGYVLNFILEVRDSFVSEPEGYSVDTVKELEQQDPAKSNKFSEADVKHPTIIAIMNESFCDLKVIGDFDTNIPVTPYLNSLNENIVKGYALASVYGAKTPNSEWEYMSGNSMAFIPNGAVVYQQYISRNPSSIVTTLKDEGYSCVAMHPYYDTGWSRNKVYPDMGFDETHFIDDFDQDNVLREYITDRELYSKIIHRFENKSDQEDLYIFGVTMQNHGGYNEKYDNFDQRVFKIGTSYSDANQYLSLLRESDDALQYLISYFKNVDEPVEIVFFGDHQPGLNSKFYQLLNGRGVSGLTLKQLEDLYTVPFFVWTNYETETRDVNITSLNYLSTITLERANIDLPPYNQFLAEMMQQVPAINASGYYSISDNKYKHLDEASGKDAEWLDKYQILQYNSMFDKRNRSSLFFP